ncbi:MAG: glycosyltransferase family 4 protein [Christensenellaceae bacterium]
MKILFMANNSGGLCNFRGELIKRLAKENHVIASTPFDDLLPELRTKGCKLVETPVDRRGINPLRDMLLVLCYIRLVNREKPDMVITYTIKPNIYGGAVCRVKKVSYAINITGLGTAFEKTGLLKRMVTFMYKFALKKAKIVFFENLENMQLFINDKIIRHDQAKLLNGAGVDLERYYMLPYPEDAKETRFLFIGRVMAEKGVDELFAAMRNLHINGVSCSLDMLGGFDEDYGAKIKQGESEGWLRYHGCQSDVRPFIKNCHCFVLPSWHEGMSNSNLECAASGRPIITSDISGCKEAVIDGVSGYTCRVEDVDDLYMKMKMMAATSRDEREKMGLAGRQHMETVFDKRFVVQETITGLGL